MLFVEPPRTQFDLNFSVLGIPVRVHPLFWLVCLLLGGDRDVSSALRWVGVVFVSILVHELGHALVARSYGANPWITLYSFGGLASYRGARTDTKSSIAIILAGPMAGFLFAAFLVVAIIATRHQFDF
ncbi:MAG: M50 family metallopeptidase, partial [Planctomycetaceae bacterium]|nr:M50 family metallopeptidase [Planctomycetaceae bacterium]